MASIFKFDDDQEESTRTPYPRQSKNAIFPRLFSLLVAFLLAGTLSLAVANYYSLFTHSFLAVSSFSKSQESSRFTQSSQPNSQEPKYTNCGSSPSQARARNCSFDLLSFSWQTPECFDAELINDFLAYPKNPWVYWTNSSAVEMVPAEVVAQGNTVAFVSWDYHVVHCTYMWMQMHRAYAERGYIDSHVDSWSHTRHCQVVTLERSYEPGIVNVRGRLRYPECRRVDIGKPMNWPSENAFAGVVAHES